MPVPSCESTGKSKAIQLANSSCVFSIFLWKMAQTHTFLSSCSWSDFMTSGEVLAQRVDEKGKQHVVLAWKECNMVVKGIETDAETHRAVYQEVSGVLRSAAVAPILTMSACANRAANERSSSVGEAGGI
jgi:hypothetical protein